MYGWLKIDQKNIYPFLGIVPVGFAVPGAEPLSLIFSLFLTSVKRLSPEGYTSNELTSITYV